MQVPLGLPQQDNHCDCGLFLLTYLEYFCWDPPTTIHRNHLDTSLRGASRASGHAVSQPVAGAAEAPSCPALWPAGRA